MVIGYGPAGELGVAVVVSLGDPVVAEDCVSVYTKPVIVYVKVGLGAPTARDAFAAVTVRSAGLTVKLRATDGAAL
jgi:hypothetical protein